MVFHRLSVKEITKMVGAISGMLLVIIACSMFPETINRFGKFIIVGGPMIATSITGYFKGAF